MLSVQLVFQLLTWICSLGSQPLKQQQQQKKAGDVPAFCLFLSFCYHSQRIHLKMFQICWHAIMGNYKVLVKCRKISYFSLSNVTDITLQASGRYFFLKHLDHRYWGVGRRGRHLRWIASLPHLCMSLGSKQGSQLVRLDLSSSFFMNQSKGIYPWGCRGRHKTCWSSTRGIWGCLC